MKRLKLKFDLQSYIYYDTDKPVRTIKAVHKNLENLEESKTESFRIVILTLKQKVTALEKEVDFY